MLSKTHITIGLATSLTVLAPQTPEEVLPIVVGGAIGSIICDIDCTWKRPTKDALIGRCVAGVLALAAFLIDEMRQGILYRYYEHTGLLPVIIGILLFIGLCQGGRRTEHRTFSHSLLANLGLCLGVGLFCFPILPAFAIGIVTHLLLDVINIREIQLFYPWKKGISLKLCPAKSKVDWILFGVGLVWLLLWGWFHQNLFLEMVLAPAL